MRRIVFPLLLTCSIFSCKQPTGISDVISNADSVAVSFFKGDGSMDSVFKVKILRNKKELQELASYIESSRTENFKCGYDGTLHFFKTNIVLKEVDFRMNDTGCMHFSFLLDGKLYNTSLSNTAKQFLRSVRQ